MTEKRFYDSVRWREIRTHVLAEEPLCRLCERMGRDTPADTVDHIKPHKGDYTLFFDRDNLQSLCKKCHDSSKRIKDHGGLLPGCDTNGIPLDDDHTWNKK